MIWLALAWPPGAAAQNDYRDRTRDAGLSGWQAVTEFADRGREESAAESLELPPMESGTTAELSDEPEEGDGVLESSPLADSENDLPQPDLLESDQTQETALDNESEASDAETAEEASPEPIASAAEENRNDKRLPIAESREPPKAKSKFPKNRAPAAGIDEIPVCYDFGCKIKEEVAINPDDWQSVADWFAKPAATPEEERKQIKKAVGWMEVVIGRYTPTHRDVAGDLPPGTNFPGQLDCIDESLNTTTYLQLFERNGLLRWHRVVERARRAAMFDQHFSGQIEEKQTGKRYIVDSWFQANGYLPYVQKLEEWMDIPFFTSYLDNSTAADRGVVAKKERDADRKQRID
ncbi:MAG: hypothetical protein U9Q71_04000 [Pseudomonadota bacterium]|nr:hypothetical protein [Pseudomonadota bacterium]